MSRSRQRTGSDGESLAAAFLEFKGARVIARNWRPHGLGLRGEVDLVVRDAEFLCFVEVKTRSSERLGAPQEAVTGAKQAQLGRLAHAFLSQHDLLDAPARFDIVEVWLHDGQKPRLHWIKNAFEVRF